MVSAELEERMLPEETEPEAAEEGDWEDSWVGPLILLGLLVAGLIAAIVVLVTYEGHAPSPPQPSAQIIGPDSGALRQAALTDTARPLETIRPYVGGNRGRGQVYPHGSKSTSIDAGRTNLTSHRPAVFIAIRGMSARKVPRFTNVVESNASTGSWAGECQCPDGEVYQVGGNNETCGGSACIGGIMTNCANTTTELNRARVTCHVRQQPADVQPYRVQLQWDEEVLRHRKLKVLTSKRLQKKSLTVNPLIQDISVKQVPRKTAAMAPIQKGTHGDYQVPITVGGTRIMTTVDTGSATLAFPGKGAHSCSEECAPRCTRFDCQSMGQVKPFYPNTGTPMHNGTVVNIYATGGWEGSVYEDTVKLDAMVVPDMEFVSITRNLEHGGQYFWMGEPPTQGNATGIMGLAYHKLPNYYGKANHPTTMSQLVSKGFPDNFSLRLCHTNPGDAPLYLTTGQGRVGEIGFGSVAALRKGTPESSFKSIKIQDKQIQAQDPGPMAYYYDTKLTGIKVGSVSESVPDNPGNWSEWQATVFDTGSSGPGALMPKVYQYVVGKLGEGVTTCGSHTNLPTLVFEYEAAVGNTPTPIKVRPEVYMEPCSYGQTGSTGSTRFGFHQFGLMNVMGNVVQSQYFEIFDRTQIPARILLAEPMDLKDKVCRCVQGILSRDSNNALKCECYPGFKGDRCDQEA